MRLKKGGELFFGGRSRYNEDNDESIDENAMMLKQMEKQFKGGRAYASTNCHAGGKTAGASRMQMNQPMVIK